METIALRDVLVGLDVITETGAPVETTPAVLGRRLGEVSIQTLMAAIYTVPSGTVRPGQLSPGVPVTYQPTTGGVSLSYAGALREVTFPSEEED